MEGEATHVVNIPGVLAKMEDRFSKSTPSSLPTGTNEKRCIFCLPTRLHDYIPNKWIRKNKNKNKKNKWFKHQVVAIGPYHDNARDSPEIIEQTNWRWFVLNAKMIG